MKRNNLDKIINESINKVLNEVLYHSLSSWDEKMRYRHKKHDTIQWLRIGEVQDSSWSNELMRREYKKRYFEVNAEQTKEMEDLKQSSVSKYLMTIRNMQHDLGVLTLDSFRFVNEDGEKTGIFDNFSDLKKTVKIYDEYMDSPWADILLDYTPTKEAYHEEFLQNLNIVNGKLVLMHTSNYKIDDGFVRNMPQNIHNYTPRSDSGYVYFWGSKTKGGDQSNSGDYTYYCEVDPNDVYDYSSNLEGFKNQNEVLEKYKFIAYYWQDEQAIAVKSRGGAKISYVKYQGEYYTPNWERIN